MWKGNACVNDIRPYTLDASSPIKLYYFFLYFVDYLIIERSFVVS